MEKLLIFICGLIVLIMSCQNQECNCEINNEVTILNDSLINQFLENDTIQGQFSTYWERFNEPIIHQAEKESYRFSIKVMLYDYMKIYRIEKKWNTYTLNIKEYAVSTTTRGREDSLASNYTKSISKLEWQNFKNSLEENCFWTIPVDIDSDDGYLDGSTWMLEGNYSYNNCSNSKYHLAQRNSPDSSKFLNICESFIKFDSLKIKSFHPK